MLGNCGLDIGHTTIADFNVVAVENLVKSMFNWKVIERFEFKRLRKSFDTFVFTLELNGGLNHMIFRFRFRFPFMFRCSFCSLTVY